MDKVEQLGLIAQAWASPRYVDSEKDQQALMVRLLAAILDELMKAHEIRVVAGPEI